MEAIINQDNIFRKENSSSHGPALPFGHLKRTSENGVQTSNRNEPSSESKIQLKKVHVPPIPKVEPVSSLLKEKPMINRRNSLQRNMS